jgi:hypothetical protein
MAASTNLTPDQRILRASVAAHAGWAKESDRAGRMAQVRAGAFARFEHQVDPDGTLEPEERHRRALSAQRAHMRALALKSSKARRKAA